MSLQIQAGKGREFSQSRVPHIKRITHIIGNCSQVSTIREIKKLKSSWQWIIEYCSISMQSKYWDQGFFDTGGSSPD